MTFCNDVDLLHWEPNIFKEATFASQMLMSGTGSLADTVLTIGNGYGSLVDRHVQADQVIQLAGLIEGSFPIVKVEGASSLRVSVLYDGLYPRGESPVPSGLGAFDNLTFKISSFWAQRRVVSDLLKQSVGIDPGEDESSIVIVNPDVLRRPCVLGTLQMVYSILAAAATDPVHLTLRADLYERLYRRALRSVRVELDTNGDGVADVTRMLNAVTLRRE